MYIEFSTSEISMNYFLLNTFNHHDKYGLDHIIYVWEDKWVCINVIQIVELVLHSSLLYSLIINTSAWTSSLRKIPIKICRWLFVNYCSFFVDVNHFQYQTFIEICMFKIKLMFSINGLFCQSTFLIFFPNGIFP